MIWPFKKNKQEQTFTLGELKGLEEITLEDFAASPIWVTDLSGEDSTGFDETSQRPIIECANVTEQILRKFVDVSIAITVIDTKLKGSANIERNLSLSCIAIWHNEKWTNPKDINSFPTNARILSIPTINGEARCFDYISGTDKAK